MMDKRFFVWVGQNATTGNANKSTGRYSMFGDVLEFSTKEKRDEFVSDYYDPNNNEYAVAGGIKKMRGYCLGMTVDDFEEYIESIPVDEMV